MKGLDTRIHSTVLAWAVGDTKMVQVTWCLNICRPSRRIEVRDSSCLYLVLHVVDTCSEPWALCATNKSALHYYCQPYSDGPGVVKCLDFSRFPVDTINVIQIRRQQVFGMCCIQSGDQELLVVAQGEAGLRAYNLKSKKVVWTFNGKPDDISEFCLFAFSLTTDGKGNLFVYDTNNKCIQIFSSSGKFQRSMPWSITDEWNGRHMISWNQVTSSLVALRSTKNFHPVKWGELLYQTDVS